MDSLKRLRFILLFILALCSCDDPEPLAKEPVKVTDPLEEVGKILTGDPQDKPKPEKEPAAPVQPVEAVIPVAEVVPGKPGFVFSPYNGKLVDVKGIDAGVLVADPAFPPEEKKYFRVPEPAATPEPTEEQPPAPAPESSPDTEAEPVPEDTQDLEKQSTPAEPAL